MACLWLLLVVAFSSDNLAPAGAFYFVLTTVIALFIGVWLYRTRAAWLQTTRYTYAYSIQVAMLLLCVGRVA